MLTSQNGEDGKQLKSEKNGLHFHLSTHYEKSPKNFNWIATPGKIHFFKYIFENKNWRTFESVRRYEKYMREINQTLIVP